MWSAAQAAAKRTMIGFMAMTGKGNTGGREGREESGSRKSTVLAGVWMACGMHKNTPKCLCKWRRPGQVDLETRKIFSFEPHSRFSVGPCSEARWGLDAVDGSSAERPPVEAPVVRRSHRWKNEFGAVPSLRLIRGALVRKSQVLV